MAACEVHHLVAGREDGPPLVLLNSTGTTVRLWDHQVEALGEDFLLIRYDARGHGASPVSPGPYSIEDLGGDLLALLDRLGIERASLCGVSLGGATALWAAANAPQRVESLAVCFSSARFGGAEAWAARAERVRAEGMAAIADDVIARWFTADMRERRPEEVEPMREAFLATPAEGYANCCPVVGNLDLRGDLAAIEAPTLVVSGGEDPATPPDHGRAVAAGIAGAEFAELAAAAHLGNYELPAEFNRLLLAHLRAGRRERKAAR